jgi:hypothetical protein
MTAAARLNLTDAESREMEELLHEYRDILAKKSDDYGRTDRVYHRIHTGGGPTDSPTPEDGP